MQEQCNDTVIIDIKNCIKQNEKPERNKKNPYREELSGSSNYYSLKTNMIFYVLMNIMMTILRVQKFAYPSP